MNSAFRYDPTKEYKATVTILGRARRPPKREPRWASELNPTIRDTVVRVGDGVDMPNLLATQLDKIMSRALKLVGDGHLLYVWLDVALVDGRGTATKRIAQWSHWNPNWETIELKSE